MSMKITHLLPCHLACGILLTSASIPLSAQTSPVAPKEAPVKIVGPGLTLLRYPLHRSQAAADKSNGYVPYQEFGEPLKAPRTISGISTWEKPVDENAVLKGYIKIEKAGTYGFRTDSNYDRNELIVDGKIVCPFGDGPNKGQMVELREGLLPIVSVAYVINTTEVRVQWLPPGAKEWTDIPNKLLSHAKP